MFKVESPARLTKMSRVRPGPGGSAAAFPPGIGKTTDGFREGGTISRQVDDKMIEVCTTTIKRRKEWQWRDTDRSVPWNAVLDGLHRSE